MPGGSSVHLLPLGGELELRARADAILKKLGILNLGGRRNSKHTPEQKKVCLACWMSANDNVELKSATKTGKATHEVIFQWYKRQLKLVGVDTLKKFKDVINSIKTKKCTDQKAALEAKIEAERKAKKCGTIRGMKKATHVMFGAALSIFAVAASCMASDGAPFSAPHSAPFFPTSNKLSISLPPPFPDSSTGGRDFHFTYGTN